MLVSLSIRNVVLIEKLDLTFDHGLGVLTGETGAGKSILLDSLGFALGTRADLRLLRPGAEQASVTAAFEIAAEHPARAILAEQDMEAEDLLVLRRVLTKDGRSRAYVNDQAVAASLLRRLADSLIEILLFHDHRGWMRSGDFEGCGHTGLVCAWPEQSGIGTVAQGEPKGIK